MNHDDAVASQAVAAYLLGDLSDAESDLFETHYFDCRICSEDVRAGTAMFVIGREIAARERDPAVTNHLLTRDPEVADVLEEIKQRLEAIQGIHGRKRDEALHIVETYAAPYALVLFYEVERLDSAICSRPRGETEK